MCRKHHSTGRQASLFSEEGGARSFEFPRTRQFYRGDCHVHGDNVIFRGENCVSCLNEQEALDEREAHTLPSRTSFDRKVAQLPRGDR
jgi:hypothetical protein